LTRTFTKRRQEKKTAKQQGTTNKQFVERPKQRRGIASATDRVILSLYWYPLNRRQLATMTRGMAVVAVMCLAMCSYACAFVSPAAMPSSTAATRGQRFRVSLQRATAAPTRRLALRMQGDIRLADEAQSRVRRTLLQTASVAPILLGAWGAEALPAKGDNSILFLISANKSKKIIHT
jgi:hypothetical protein